MYGGVICGGNGNVITGGDWGGCDGELRETDWHPGRQMTEEERWIVIWRYSRAHRPSHSPFRPPKQPPSHTRYSVLHCLARFLQERSPGFDSPAKDKWIGSFHSPMPHPPSSERVLCVSQGLRGVGFCWGLTSTHISVKLTQISFPDIQGLETRSS